MRRQPSCRARSGAFGCVRKVYNLALAARSEAWMTSCGPGRCPKVRRRPS
ncbi:helix-turn-helix domain-containing protein [Streptomyces sp. NPDC058629]